MPYDNIPGVRAVYKDGAFIEPSLSDQPRILVIGTGNSGLTNETFTVTNVRQAETEFGAATDVMKGVHEVIAQGADNIAIMRVGGRQGNLSLTDSAAGTLVITPEYRDDAILSRYALAMSVTAGVQRIAIFDLEDEAWVYDSDEILVINEGAIEVIDGGLDLFTTGSFTDPTSMTTMALLASTDFTAIGTATMPSTGVVATQGTDGTGRTLVEKYAMFNSGYHLLDFQDADLILPMGVYIDDDNVADGDSLNLWAGPPLAGEADSLGYVWQYIYQGKLYTYFTDSATYFTNAASGVAATSTVNTDLDITAVKEGAGINGKVTLEVTAAASSDVVTATVTEVAGVIKIVIDVQNTTGTKTNAEAATAANTALAAFVMSNGVTANNVVTLAGSTTVLNAAIPEQDIDTDTPGVGDDYASHTELTGDAVPAAVATRFAAGTDSELREVNFAHQLATFCELASTTWSTMIGAISFKIPPDFSRAQIATWVGELPTFTTIGTDLAIDSPSVNGNGLLGFKFLAGKSVTSAGYRAHMVEEGNSTDGYAYGGFIKTKGASLPNGTDWPYGIKDSDEALDTEGAPVDLGKHILVTYSWPIQRNGYNGGALYRGSLSGSLLGLIAITPENLEPIGDRGLLRQITSPPRIHSTQIDALASIHTIGTRFEEGLGHILVSVKTAAHRDSDYQRLSTIRCVNRELAGLRLIARDFIGQPFTPERLTSLQSSMDAFLLAERNNGFNQGANAVLRYTRSDRILGKLEINLRMVPPFSIEQITVNTTLAADEGEL